MCSGNPCLGLFWAHFPPTKTRLSGSEERDGGSWPCVGDGRADEILRRWSAHTLARRKWLAKGWRACGERNGTILSFGEWLYGRGQAGQTGSCRLIFAQNRTHARCYFPLAGVESTRKRACVAAGQWAHPPGAYLQRLTAVVMPWADVVRDMCGRDCRASSCGAPGEGSRWHIGLDVL
jgi:hypothetical protein